MPARQKKNQGGIQDEIKNTRNTSGAVSRLGTFISFAAEAPAHEYRDHGSDGDRKAEDVDINDETQMKEFLTHVVEHFNQILSDTSLSNDQKTTEIAIIGRRYREEGVFYHKATNVYSMGVNSNLSITSHPAHPQLYGKRINVDAGTSDIAAAVDAIEKGSTPTEAACQGYMYGGEQRVACGQKVKSPSGDVTTIVGLHHAEDDPAIFLPDLCGSLTIETTAKDVYDDPTNANLQAYVKSIIKVAQEQVARITGEVATENPTLLAGSLTGDLQAQAAFGVKVLEKLYDVVACFGNSPDTRHESIYAFVMGTDPAGTVLLNGNNFGLIGLDLQVNDDELPGEDKSIASLFRNALTGGSGEPQDGQNAFVDYRWDDPTTDEDNIDNWFKDQSVPGSSPKRSYIEVANLYKDVPNSPALLYIFGSGVYNPAGSGSGGGGGTSGGSDDGGCAIAGAGHASQGALLGLFLTAALVFSAAFLRKRA